MKKRDLIVLVLDNKLINSIHLLQEFKISKLHHKARPDARNIDFAW